MPVPAVSEKMLLVGVLFFTLAMQSLLWFGPYEFVDSGYWREAAQTLASGSLPSPETRVASHPATSILIPAAGLILLGVSSTTSVPLTMALLTSVAVTLIVRLCRRARPESAWWLLVLPLVALDPRYLVMTVPSALAALLTVICVLVILDMREKGAGQENVFWLGLAAALLFVTRTDVALEFAFVSLPYLWYLLREKLLTTLGFMLLFLVALNPFLWQPPSQYLASFTREIGLHISDPVGFGYHWSQVSLALFGYLLCMIIVFAKPALSSVKKDFLLYLLAGSAVLAGIIFLLPYHPVRYFFPLIVLWEVMLPLLFLDALGRSGLRIRFAKSLPYALALLFLGERTMTLCILWQ